ncbi:MAG TPA: bifunctional adenosylcobinamide kinase/adenosylcobinamide-phosphate guanylyltransferase [Rubrobacteraceae bacterium]|nr:bifunctional adenosylcobinamide kinase/adenosylcobinamide-phosphate guanylyltransferase [Rubrobacteraceae bacterium]
MRAVLGARAGILPGRGAGHGRERAARRRPPGGAVAVHALILGGARSGKSAFAENLAQTLGANQVLYVATAVAIEDRDLERRVRAHRERRPAGWGTLELGGSDLGQLLECGTRWNAVLLDSLTLWVAARISAGADGRMVLASLDVFLRKSETFEIPFIVVSDEVGLGVVPESESGRYFRDVLGLANQRVAVAAGEVHLCVAGIPVRVK